MFHYAPVGLTTVAAAPAAAVAAFATAPAAALAVAAAAAVAVPAAATFAPDTTSASSDPSLPGLIKDSAADAHFELSGPEFIFNCCW